MEQIIKGHNAKLTKQTETSNGPQCNCINPTECPLSGKCQQKNVVYCAKVVETGVEDTLLGEYYGCTYDFKILLVTTKSLLTMKYTKMTPISVNLYGPNAKKALQQKYFGRY